MSFFPAHASSAFSQVPFRCRLEWGRRGASDAAARGDAVVLVDTLSFCSCVVSGVANGGGIRPAASQEDALAIARATGAQVAVSRQDVPALGRFSLSPLTFAQITLGEEVVLSSPNGASCARAASRASLVYAATFLNAQAISATLTRLLDVGQQCVTFVACGERWITDSDDGPLRFAVEDYLAAGAILSGIPHDKSPEARASEAAFLGVRADLAWVLRECASGRELRERGFGPDVQFAAQLDLHETVPLLQDGCFRALAV